VEEFSKIEMAKRQLKAERLQSELLEGKLSESSMKVCLYTSFIVGKTLPTGISGDIDSVRT